MRHRLTQPEEIDQVLKEIAEEDKRAGTPFADNEFNTVAAQENWSGIYVSPYRAEYIKSHGFTDQGSPFQR